ncbi:two-component system response regulator CreB [Luteimonas sp. SMYT11W]|uniref:Two-component system response regulator CreB n=1 Tax=Luteimonas flava TaxID=3115822 RepID=A0ABU7WFG7_9GAMM
MASLLLVEDEIAIAETVVYALQADGHTVRHCLDGQQARAAVVDTAFDLAILDVGLPDISGFALCGELRRRAPLPVIFLTAQAAESERVLGFDLGADDYIAKPFSLRELVARVRVVLRRAPDTVSGEAARSGAFEHDAEGRRIRYHGHALDLTRYEYGLLAALLARPGAVLSRMQLMERVWGDALDSGDRTVDTHVKTVRGKLRAVAPGSDPLRTHRGIGYSLDLD